MRCIRPRSKLLAAAIASTLWPLAAAAQTTQDIRIVTYNTQDDVSSPTPTGALPYLATVLEGIGQQEYVGDNILQLPDIIALQETTSNPATVAPLTTDLNTYYNSSIFNYSSYQATTSDGDTDGGGPNGLIYNQKTMNLMASVGVGTPASGGNGEFRQVVRYEFQPLADKGTNNGVFYVYDSHYKSGSAGTSDDGSTDGALRNGEAQIIRNDEAANLPANAAVLYVGDYNGDGSTEAAYQTITAAKSPSGINQGQGIDPLNPTDNYNETWAKNSAYTNIMTEKDTELEYRDDIQMMTSNVYNDTPGTLNYIANSYHAFGNNGTTNYEGNIDNGTNTALNDINGHGPLTSSQVLGAMQASLGSDHLPVVADYDIVLSPLMLTWNNAGGTGDGMTWDTTSQNWNGGTGVSIYSDSDNVIFNDANNGHYAVTLNTTVSPGSVVVSNSSGNYTFSGSGSIAGAGSLTKSGTGALTLSTANTYSGGTTVNGGTLDVSNSSGSATGTGNVTLNGGVLTSDSGSISGNVIAGIGAHIIAPGGIGSIGSLTVGGLTTSNLTTLNFDLGTGGPGVISNGDLLTLGSGTVSVGSGTDITFGVDPATLGDDYRLIGGNLSGIPVSALSNFVLPTVPAGVSYSLSESVDPGYIDLVVSSSGPTALTWNNIGGSGNGTLWDTSQQNWNNGSGAATYADGSNVTFNDTNNSNYGVTLYTTVTPGSVTVNNSNGNYTISGAGSIAGTGAFSKSGSGVLTLSNTGINTYSGGTTVSAGTLLIGAAGALPAASNVTITGGTLQLGAGTGAETLSSLSITGGGVFDVNNNHIIISYAPGSQATADAAIRGYLISGYAGGAWNGAGGLDSSAANALFASGNTHYGLGYADGADGVVSGLLAGQIEVEYTLYGDANLDGVVNGTDFGILAANFGQQVNNWDQGDFNYDGVVNGTDFGALAGNFGQQASGADVQLPSSDYAALDAFAAANGLLSDVPEPATATLLLAAGIGFLSSRRRRSEG
jgi:autotransporter-associated beta strand protein